MWREDGQEKKKIPKQRNETKEKKAMRSTNTGNM
jgi:hypothetical protein